MVFSFKIFSRIFYSLLVAFSIIMLGSFGFMFFEDYTFLEAFYMTIITISTVGFGEIRPLSDSGRIFTAILIISSIGTFAYTISAITTYFVAGEYKDIFKENKLNKQLKDLNGHTIVCGYGRVGDMAVDELLDHRQEIVVIENDKEKLELLLQKYPNIPIIDGDATRDEDLEKARIREAKALITTLPNDADNLYVVLTARELNNSLTIISRASKAVSVRKLRVAGATNVIMPDRVGGAHMASLVVNPDVIEFLDHIRIQGGAEINLEEVNFTDLPEDFKYQTLGEMQVRNRIGINVIGFKKEDGEYVINPGPETQIVPNSKLFVLGNPDQIRLLSRVFGLQSPV